MPKKKTELIIDETTEANIKEKRDAKGEIISQEVIYKAGLKENEINDTTADDETTDFDDTDFLDLQSERDFEEVPKTKLELMFEDLQAFAAQTNQTTFYAMVSRVPDAMSDNFYNRFMADAPAFIGKFQFGLRDIFDFNDAISKLNNNSGGRFNITVYDFAGEPIKIAYGYSARQSWRNVGIANLFVPNPVRELENNNGNQKQDNVFLKLAEMHQESTRLIIDGQNKILAEMNKPKEKSTFEKALEQKMINDILNPKDNTSSFEEKMSNFMLMPMVAEKMAQRMFPEPPAPKEPTTLDTIKEIAEMPLVKDLSTLAINAIDAKLIGNAPAANFPDEIEQTENPNQLPQGAANNNDMQEMFNKIVSELETDNPLDNSNPLFNELKAEYTDKFPMIVSSCKMFDFTSVFGMLYNIVTDNGKNRQPFNPFLNTAETDKTQTLVFNERGNRMVIRLQEFYNFLKTQE